jgi:hypothetical protein
MWTYAYCEVTAKNSAQCEYVNAENSSPGGDFHRVILLRHSLIITVLDWVLQLCVYGDEETWLDICTPVSKSEDIDLKCLLPCTSTDFKLGVNFQAGIFFHNILQNIKGSWKLEHTSRMIWEIRAWFAFIPTTQFLVKDSAPSPISLIDCHVHPSPWDMHAAKRPNSRHRASTCLQQKSLQY